MRSLKIIVPALVVAVLWAGSALGAVNEFNARINVAFQDRTIMFYVGANAGLVPGERYAVFSNGYKVATVQLTRVDAYSANATIVEAAHVLTEGIIYTFKYASGSEMMHTSRPHSLVKPIEDEAPVKTPEKPAARTQAPREDEGLAEASRRRATPREEEQAEAQATRPRETTPPKKEPAKSKAEPKKQAEKKPSDEKILNTSSSNKGFSGVHLFPSADVITQDKARISIGTMSGISASSGYRLVEGNTTYIGHFTMNRKDRTIDFTYGLAENAEFYVSTTDTSMSYHTYQYNEAQTSQTYSSSRPFSSKQTAYGFKYSVPFAWRSEADPQHKIAGMVSWKKARLHDSGIFGVSAGDIYSENVRDKVLAYGLAGSFQLSHLARGHVYVGKQRRTQAGVTSAAGSASDKMNGYALEYAFDPRLDVLAEYFRTKEGRTGGVSDTKITEKSLVLRYKYKPNLHFDAGWNDYQMDLYQSTFGSRFGDKYYSLKMNYQI